MARKSSYSGRATPNQDNPNVFDDEFEVFDGIADGMMDGSGPGQDRGQGQRDSDAEDHQGLSTPPISSFSAHLAYPPSPQLSTPPTPREVPSRSSIRKPHPGGGGGIGESSRADNPFFSPDDDENEGGEEEGLLQRATSLHSQSTTNYAPGHLAHRSLSSTSSHHFARSNSPRIGADGPSHPYEMYPQDTLPRSPSVASSSTIRAPARQSSVQGAPQHPYSMYPQGVMVEEEDDDDENVVLPVPNPVPLGFPGQPTTFRRQIGPDGEEQDIIGIDGHTEQLPPYSRYPDEGPGDSKVPLLAAPTPLHSRAPVAGTDPSMPLMHDVPDLIPQQQPQQQLQSMTDESELARHGSRPSMSNLEQMVSRDTLSTDSSLKSWKEKNWKEKRKTRFCGIPFWWILLTICVLTFIALVLGGVIGGFLGGQKHESKKQSMSPQAVVTIVSTSLLDASVIPSPTALSPPTGTFALEMSTPEHTQAQCLIHEDQWAAWSCDIGGTPAIALDVSPPPGSSGPLQAWLLHAAKDTQLYYGAIQEYMTTLPSPFLTVSDNDDPDLGPAFYFQATYDKVVVVPDGSVKGKILNNQDSDRKRDYPPSSYTLPKDWLKQQETDAEEENAPLPSSQPWLCVWNNTFIEGFIYVKQDASPSSSSSPPTSNLSATLTTTSPSTPQATTTPSDYPYQSGNVPAWLDSPYTDTYTEDVTVSTTLSLAYTTATFIGEPSTYPQWASGIYQEEQEAAGQGEGDYDDEDSYHGGSASARRRRENLEQKLKRGSMSDLIDSLDIYPYVVKIEERRLPNNAIQPYCQQVQILDNGEWGWYGDDGSNEPNTIMLDEEDPQYGAYESAGIAGSKLKNRQTVTGGCHCQWMSGGDGS